MDIPALHTALHLATRLLRKASGSQLSEGVDGGCVLHVMHAPLFNQFELVPGETMVDLHFAYVAVDQDEAERQREAFRTALATFPDPDRLPEGLSFFELAVTLRSEDLALRFLALGAVLGAWELITPEALGFDGTDARALALHGLVLTTDYRPL